MFILATICQMSKVFGMESSLYFLFIFIFCKINFEKKHRRAICTRSVVELKVYSKTHFNEVHRRNNKQFISVHERNIIWKSRKSIYCIMSMMSVFLELAKRANQINVETDMIVVFTHAMLIECGFLCLVTNSEVSLHCFICHYCIFHMRNIS